MGKKWEKKERGVKERGQDLQWRKELHAYSYNTLPSHSRAEEDLLDNSP
jgi:hypothetical protein